MKYFAARAVALGTDYTGACTFPTQGQWSLAMNKLAVFVDLTDAVGQLLTDEGGWTNDQNLEILFRAGFSGRDPLPPFYAVRFKIWSQTTFSPGGHIDVEVYQV